MATVSPYFNDLHTGKLCIFKPSSFCACLERCHNVGVSVNKEACLKNEFQKEAWEKNDLNQQVLKNKENYLLKVSIGYAVQNNLWNNKSKNNRPIRMRWLNWKSKWENFMKRDDAEKLNSKYTEDHNKSHYQYRSSCNCLPCILHGEKESTANEFNHIHSQSVEKAVHSHSSSTKKQGINYGGNCFDMQVYSRKENKWKYSFESDGRFQSNDESASWHSGDQELLNARNSSFKAESLQSEHEIRDWKYCPEPEKRLQSSEVYDPGNSQYQNMPNAQNLSFAAESLQGASQKSFPNSDKSSDECALRHSGYEEQDILSVQKPSFTGESLGVNQNSKSSRFIAGKFSSASPPSPTDFKIKASVSNVVVHQSTKRPDSRVIPTKMSLIMDLDNSEKCTANDEQNGEFVRNCIVETDATLPIVETRKKYELLEALDNEARSIGVSSKSNNCADSGKLQIVGTEKFKMLLNLGRSEVEMLPKRSDEKFEEIELDTVKFRKSDIGKTKENYDKLRASPFSAKNICSSVVGERAGVCCIKEDIKDDLSNPCTAASSEISTEVFMTENQHSASTLEQKLLIGNEELNFNADASCIAARLTAPKERHEESEIPETSSVSPVRLTEEMTNLNIEDKTAITGQKFPSCRISSITYVNSIASQSNCAVENKISESGKNETIIISSTEKERQNISINDKIINSSKASEINDQGIKLFRLETNKVERRIGLEV